MTDLNQAVADESTFPAKQEIPEETERTVQGKTYTPATDIFETNTDLVLVMELPGVAVEALSITLENRALSVEAPISLTPYTTLRPLYSEYALGHYARRFSLPAGIDPERISATISDGVLTLTLPKGSATAARTIPVNS